MNFPTELWYNVFFFLTQQSQSKFSSLWNLHSLNTLEIKLMYSSNDLWFDIARNGYIKLMKLLIKSGTDLNIQSNYLWTALHSASYHNYKDCVELLIKAGGIDMNIQDSYGYTALHLASIRGHKDCVELLIKSDGINVNKQDNTGSTALHFARKFGHKKIIELLEKTD